MLSTDDRMNTDFRESLKNVIGTFFALCLGAFLVVWWFSEGHGASLSSLAKIHTGMTRHEVVKILGKPGTVDRATNGSESWFYTRATFCAVKIHLDENGKVKETD